MSWLDLTSNRLVVTQGVAESARFGMSVLNIRCGSELHNTDQLWDELENSRYDLAVVKYPSTNTRLAMQLNLEKYSVCIADPTVYWMSQKMLTPQRVSHPQIVRVVEVSVSELDSVVRVIESSFAGYQSHWHFNPKTRHIQMAEAYSEWVQNIIGTPFSHTFLVFNDDSDDPIGMAMINISGTTLEILLAGISATHQGKGLYGELLKYLTEFGSVRGVNQLVISTQAGNLNVQKAWIHQGWVPAMTVQTIHVEKK